MKSLLLFGAFAFVAKSQNDTDTNPLADIPADPSFLLSFLAGTEYACDSTADCSGLGSGFGCDTTTNICIFECTTSDECALLGSGSGLGDCENGVCVVNSECVEDDDCASLLGFSCGSDGTCKDPAFCTENSDCGAQGVGYCDTEMGLCQPEQCTDSSDCITSGYVCFAQTGFCIESCETADVCQGPLFCNSNSGFCETACTEDDDCTGFTNTCLEGTCILTCSEDTDCENIGIPNAKCTQGTCIPSQDVVIGGDECVDDSDCSGSAVCEPNVNVCYAPCDTSSDCEGTEQCVEATSLPMLGEMLPEGTKTCTDPSSGDCSSDSDCAEGYKCNSLLQSTCYPSCSSDADCASLGFGDTTPCITNSYSLLVTTIEIKFCDPNETPTPTMAEGSGVVRLEVVGTMMVVMTLVGLM